MAHGRPDMASEAGDKPFDVMRWLREVRDRLNDDLADMSAEDRFLHPLLSDDASGTDGLSMPEDTLQEPAKERGQELRTHFLGHEINGGVHAVCEADLLLKRNAIRPVTLRSVWQT